MKTPRTRVQRRPVHGVLLLDKPLGLSSNDALQKAKWLLRAEKAGHTGTLDPLATGVLPLCFGAATKFSALQLDAVKTYEATAVLGIKTSTGDAEGAVISEREVNVTDADLQRVQQQFMGKQRQIPPMHSALKRDGKPLYEYARQGIELERESRDIEVYSLVLKRFEPSFESVAQADSARGAIKIIVTVSKGTYIRTLGEDIGEALGCGAHLSSLRRTDTGGLGLGNAYTLAQLEAMLDADRMAALQPVDSLLAGHQAVTLDNDNAGRFLSGLRRRTELPDNAHVAVYGDTPKALLGSAHIKAGELIPTRLLSPIEVSQILTQDVTQNALASPVLN